MLMDGKYCRRYEFIFIMALLSMFNMVGSPNHWAVPRATNNWLAFAFLGPVAIHTSPRSGSKNIPLSVSILIVLQELYNLVRINQTCRHNAMGARSSHSYHFHPIAR